MFGPTLRTMANVRVPPFTEAPSTVVGSTPQTEFGFNFPFWESADIEVYVDGVLLDAADYTVEGLAVQDGLAVEGGYGSGTVTLDTAVSNVTVTIDRLVVGDRETQFGTSSPLGMRALNADLNRVTARQQDLARKKIDLPSDRASKFLAFDADGNAIASSGGVPSVAVSAVGELVVAAASEAAAREGIGAAANDKLALLVDDYYETADGSDWAPAFTRAFAAGLTSGRELRLTSGATYAISTAVEIENDAGWTPTLYGNNALIDIQAEAAGFRYRGIKSGQAANPAEGGIRDLMIDANSIAVSNGVWAITMENGGGLTFDNVFGFGWTLGYGILNFRYADGGAPVGKPTFRNCRFTGTTLANTGSAKWYGISDSGDLSSVMPGGSIAAGAVRAVATINATGNNGVGMPRFANVYQWTNSTGSPITVPSSLLEADLTAAGLTKGAATATLNGATVTAPVYDYYSNGGDVLPDCVVKGAGGLIDGFDCDGSYYPVYLSGVDSYDVRNYRVENPIRGFACEWGAKKVRVRGIRVRESYSSAWLFGYNCPDCSVDDFEVENITSRWVGEALNNVQLSSPRFTLGRGRMQTSSTATGQYFIKASVDCSDFRVDGPVYLKGDCAKAYVCVESAYNGTITAANPEHYAASSAYDGGASNDMSGIRLRNIEIVADTTKAAYAGATAICLMQVADAVNGQIGLSDILLENITALSDKHVRSFKIYEGATAAKQVNDVRMSNCLFKTQLSTSNAALRMILPRRWAHFAWVKNVTNMDDNQPRSVPDVATPDLTFGKIFDDTATTALNGILGGQGASSSEGYDGREIYIRGNSSRAWTTVSHTSGTRDGLRITGSPVTPSNVQVLRLVYRRIPTSWIGGIV